jgi:hypothetical protein
MGGLLYRVFVRGYIQKFPDWVDNEINNNLTLPYLLYFHWYTSQNIASEVWYDIVNM